MFDSNDDLRSVSVSGYLTDCHLFDAKQLPFGETVFTFKLRTNPYVLEEIEHRMELLKEMERPAFDNPDIEYQYDNKSRVTDHDCVVFTTRYQPRLCEVLRNLPHDQAMEGIEVTVLGNLSVLKDGNGMITAHQITVLPSQFDTELEEDCGNDDGGMF